MRSKSVSSTAARCPLCGAPRKTEYRPFCSRACRDRDLNRWFGEDYRVAADDPFEELGEGNDGGGK